MIDIFLALHNANLRIRREKCTFFANEIEFLEHKVRHDVISPLRDKTRTLDKFPRPRSAKNILQFLGLANYYRCFVENFSRLASPFYKLTKASEEFVWTEEQESAFQAIKKCLTSQPLLTPFYPARKTKLTTDASQIRIGSVLTQTDEEGIEYVVGYYSRKLSDTENGNHSSDHECFAVIESVKTTDCKALSWIRTVKDKNRRLWRWSVLLSAFDFTVIHKPGKTNVVADALSRNPVAAAGKASTCHS